mmetsp:Transcript_88563/g.247707  ORF Transcript_88563/g.247707 Transcript_88563/m.247707 type:complete len:208 (+) Transcript_88563:419-1042(+)
MAVTVQYLASSMWFVSEPPSASFSGKYQSSVNVNKATESQAASINLICMAIHLSTNTDIPSKCKVASRASSAALRAMLSSSTAPKPLLVAISSKTPKRLSIVSGRIASFRGASSACMSKLGCSGDAPLVPAEALEPPPAAPSCGECSASPSVEPKPTGARSVSLPPKCVKKRLCSPTLPTNAPPAPCTPGAHTGAALPLAAARAAKA